MGSALGSIGTAVGGFVGGPVGASIGGAIGGMIGGNQSSSNAQQAYQQTGQMSFDQARELGRESASMAEFKPYAISNAIGNVNARGTSLDMSLSPQQQAYADALNAQAGQYLGKQTYVDPQGLFNQMQAMRHPEIERQQALTDAKLAAQGRLGVGGALYGGSNPEQFGLNKAIQEQLSADAYNSMLNANQITSQNLGNQKTALGLSYVPQDALTAQAKLAYDFGNQYNQSLQNQASLFSGNAAVGLPAMTSANNAALSTQLAQQQANNQAWNTIGQSVGGLFSGGNSSLKMYNQYTPDPWANDSNWEQRF